MLRDCQANEIDSDGNGCLPFQFATCNTCQIATSSALEALGLPGVSALDAWLGLFCRESWSQAKCSRSLETTGRVLDDVQNSGGYLSKNVIRVPAARSARRSEAAGRWQSGHRQPTPPSWIFIDSL